MLKTTMQALIVCLNGLVQMMPLDTTISIWLFVVLVLSCDHAHKSIHIWSVMPYPWKLTLSLLSRNLFECICVCVVMLQMCYEWECVCMCVLVVAREPVDFWLLWFYRSYGFYFCLFSPAVAGTIFLLLNFVVLFAGEDSWPTSTGEKKKKTLSW